MAACSTISRFALVMLNLLLFIIGALLIVVGILTIYVPDAVVSNDILAESEDLQVVFNAMYITIAAWVCVGLGVVVVIVSLCGCLGSACSSKVLLGIYIFVVVQIVIVQVGVAVVIYLAPDWFIDSTEEVLAEYTNQYPSDPSLPDAEHREEWIAFNFLQYSVGCCGVNGPRDYVNLTDTSLTGNDRGIAEKYYLSCCVVKDKSQAALLALDGETDVTKYNYTGVDTCKRYFTEIVWPNSETDDDNLAQWVNTNGCIDEIFVSLRTYAIAAIAVVAIQIFIILIACIVCCSVEDDEKPI